MERGQHPSAELPLLYADTALAERLLGFSADALRSLDETKYSERAVIAADASNAVVTMRDRIVEAAQASGMAVTQDMIDGWRPNDQEVRALRHETRNIRRRLQMLEGLREYTTDERYMAALRPHQREVIHANRYFMEFAERMPGGRGKAGYNDEPTGTGKTVEMIHLTRALKLKEEPDDPIRVQLLVPTTPLLRQTIGMAEKKSERKGFAKFAPKLQVGAYYQGEHNLSSSVGVITNASYNGLVAAGKLPHYDARIIDETHTGLGENISRNVQATGKDIVTIGFSATPDYHDEKKTEHILQHKIHELDLPTAIQRGLLAPVSAELRRVELALDEADLPEDPTERRLAIQAKYLQARLDDAMPDILAAIREGKGVIIRCPGGGDIAYARRAAELLREQIVTTYKETDARRTRLVRAAALGGSTQKASFQTHAMQEFNKGNVDVLTYVNLINMGADLPPGKLFVNLAPTTSRVVMVQGIGRVLRLQIDEHGRPVEAKVIDYEDPNAEPGQQYTALDALNLKAGRVAKVASMDQNDAPYERGTAEAYEIRDIDYDVAVAGEVGSVLLGHDQDVMLDTSTFEEPAEVQADQGELTTELFDFAATCDWFGTSEHTMKNYLNQSGFTEHDMLSRDDLALLALEYEELDIETLPEEGYIAVEEVVRRFKYKDKPIRYVIERRKEGFEITRFRDGRDGKVRHYMRRQDVRLPGGNV